MARKKTTKRCAACCEKKPVTADRAAYNRALRKLRKGSAKLGLAKHNGLRFASGYNPPHSSEYPSYGAPCWQQAYSEMIAWFILADAADKLLRADRILASGGYMPLPVYQQIVTTYMVAMGEYNDAWFALETCLHGTPV